MKHEYNAPYYDVYPWNSHVETYVGGLKKMAITKVFCDTSFLREVHSGKFPDEKTYAILLENKNITRYSKAYRDKTPAKPDCNAKRSGATIRIEVKDSCALVYLSDNGKPHNATDN